jgi:head-tail adaptor
MQILPELIRIISKAKLRAIRKLGFPFADDNKLSEMYTLLADGMEEPELIASITGRSRTSGTYRHLKAELTDRLIASLFLVDLSLPSYNNRQRAYFEVHKKWAAAKILLAKNARSAGVEMAEQTYRQALRYEFNDLAADIAKNLRMVFANLIGNYKKYQQYALACRELQQIVFAENLAEENYARLIVEFYRKKASNEAIMQEAIRAQQELAPYLLQSDSYTLHLYSGLLRMSSYTATADYEEALSVCDKMIAFFEQKTYTASVPLQIAYYQKLLCHFQLRQFGETQQFVERGLELLQEGSYNWFKFQETYLLLALHSQRYTEAYHIYQDAVQQSRFSSLTDEVKEYWQILEAYLHYLVELGEIPEAKNDPRFTKFKIGRFLNQTPHFSKDKSGMNVSILIVQILFFVARNRYHETIEKIDAVEQYCRRHLFQEDTLRAYYFIKALLELPKNSFHQAAVQRKASKYLQRMEKYSLQKAGQANFNTEVIPFEWLWEAVISQLQHKFFK